MKDVYVGFRVTKEEEELIMSIAERLHLTKSSYARQAVMEKTDKLKEERNDDDRGNL